MKWLGLLQYNGQTEGLMQYNGQTEQFIFAVCFISTLTIALLTNVAIIGWFVLRKKFARSYHRAYLNLAATDMLIALYGAAFRGPSFISPIGSATLCSITLHMSCCITMLNFASILPITTDRLIAVFLPFKYSTQSHSQHQNYFILGIWVSSLLITAILSVYARAIGLPFAEYNTADNSCTLGRWDPHNLYMIYLATFYYLLPLLLNVGAYSLITHRFRTRLRSAKCNCKILVVRACVICTVFTMSWSPHFIFQLVGVGDRNYFWVAQSFLYLNAALDPPIYFFSRKQILRRLKKSIRAGKSRILIRSPCNTPVQYIPRPYSTQSHRLHQNI